MVEIVGQRTLLGVGANQQRPNVGEEVLDGRPHRLPAVSGGHQRRLPGEVPDEHAQAAGGDPAAVEVAQVDAVEPGEVGLDLIAVLIEQVEEAG